MKTKDQLDHYKGANLTPAPQSDEPTADDFAKWDSLDLTPLLMIPKFMTKTSGAKTHNQAGDLFAEGIRGRTARSELAKDIEVNRQVLRLADTLLTTYLGLLSREQTSERRIRLIDQVVDRAHRRMIASYELLARLESAPAPTVKISADQAAFQIDARGTST